MKISEWIEKLQGFQAEHGDIDAVISVYEPCDLPDHFGFSELYDGDRIKFKITTYPPEGKLKSDTFLEIEVQY